MSNTINSANRGLRNIPRLALLAALLCVVASASQPVANTATQNATAVSGANAPQAIDLRAYGGVCDGKTDNTRAWSDAKQAAKAQNVSRIQFPSGVCYAARGFELGPGDSGLLGVGAGAYQNGPGSVVRGTTAKCDPSSNCLKITGGDNVLSHVGFVNILATHGATAGNGTCVRVDATRGTIADVTLDQVRATACANGVALTAGSGAGGFLFNMRVADVDITQVGNVGMSLSGRVGQVQIRKVYITAPQPLVMDGGAKRELGNIQADLLTASAADNRHFCMALRDASMLTFTQSHLETCPYGLVQIESVEDSAFNGGFWQQTGTAFGVYFGGGNSRLGNSNIVLDPKGWLNSSTHKRITYRNAVETHDIQLGWSSRHQLTPDDVEADGSSVSPIFIGKNVRAFAVPLFWGDAWKFADARAAAGTQGDYFPGVWRDPASNIVHLGSATAAAPNGVLFDGPARFAASLNVRLSTPRSSSDACAPGDLKYDENFIYICTAPNKWKRAPLSNF